MAKGVAIEHLDDKTGKIKPSRRLLHAIPSIFGLLVFLAVLYILRRIFKEHHPSEIWHELQSLPASALLSALALTIASFTILTLYDYLAIKYLNLRVKYPLAAKGAVVGYALSNVTGPLFLSGGAVRYRIYSFAELSVIDITKLMLFSSVTLWLGFFALAGIVFSTGSVEMQMPAHVTPHFVRVVGLIFFFLASAYITTSFVRQRPIRVRSWVFSLPSPRLALAQLLAGVMDWMIVGGVLYAVLPHSESLGYIQIMQCYLLAQFLAILSMVPGGWGVFDVTLGLFLSRFLPGPSIIAGLAAFRAIYYIIPFIAGVGMLGVHEVMQARKQVPRFTKAIGTIANTAVPRASAVVVFSAGLVLLLSGATPSVVERFAWLLRYVPLPVLEGTHFLASLIGASLLLLARGLQRRLDAAYVFSMAGLFMGCLFSIFKGLDYEEAIVLAFVFALMLPCHRYFYRRASIFSQPFTRGWIVAIVMVLVGVTWIGLFSYEPVRYSSELWTRFHFGTHYLGAFAARFMRGMAGAVILVVLFAIAKLLRPSAPEPHPPSSSELEKAETICRRSPSTQGFSALVGDKDLLFSPNQNAFIMYGIKGDTWVALGDPVGPEAEWPDLIWKFCEMSDRHGGKTVFYLIPPASIHYYLDIGLTVLKLGEEARVSLEEFSLEGTGRKGLRYSCHRMMKEGASFEILSPEEVPPLLPVLKQISDEWLADKHVAEKHFSIGYFNPEYLKRFPVAVVRQKDKVIAFANIWAGENKNELSIDLMRYRKSEFHSVMDYMFVELMLWGAREGYKRFNLGMAPLSGLEARSLAPAWYRVGAFIFRHGEHFYNFQGLRHYKEKFDPEWEPRYLASPGGLAIPSILTNVTALISGGVKDIIMK